MGNYFGYERISTKEERGMQHFSRQDAALKKYAAKHKIDYVRIYGDDSSGKDFIRREWIQLEEALHEGDTIVFKDLAELKQLLVKHLKASSTFKNRIFFNGQEWSDETVKTTKKPQVHHIITATYTAVNDKTE
ncbi:MAG: recombinase family protein [Solobacterium sp.]|nr:recombinase family protein [Solobacterium sp.]